MRERRSNDEDIKDEDKFDLTFAYPQMLGILLHRRILKPLLSPLTKEDRDEAYRSQWKIKESFA